MFTGETVAWWDSPNQSIQFEQTNNQIFRLNDISIEEEQQDF